MDHAYTPKTCKDPSYLMAVCWWGLVATPSSEMVKPPPGPPSSVSNPQHLYPSQSRRTLWATSPFWYTAFIPRNPVFRGDPTFASLHRQDIVTCVGGYRLSIETADQWLSLERHIMKTSALLVKACGSLWPEGTRSPYLPVKFGYDDVHSTEKEARHACTQARGAFCNLIGYMAACIAIINTRHPVGTPRWIHAVGDIHPAHPH